MNLYDCGGHGTYLHRHGRYRSSHGHEGSAGGQVLEAFPKGTKHFICHIAYWEYLRQFDKNENSLARSAS